MTEYAIIISLALLTRIAIVKKTETKFDSYGHLYFVKLVSEQNAGPFGGIRLGVAAPADYRQPFLWHWLMGLLPFRFIMTHQKWINGIIDASFSISIFFISRLIGMSEAGSMFVALLYIFSPILFSSISAGPRLHGFTPRLSSEIAANLFFIVTLLPVGLDDWGVIILGSILASILILISKFGTQVLFLITPLVSLVLRDYIPLFALIGGMTISILITRGAIMSSLKAQAKHLIWYYKENANGRMPVSNRNGTQRLFSGEGFKFQRKYLIGFLYRVISLNSYTAVLTKLPAIIILPILYFLTSRDSAIDAHFVVPVAVATAVYFIVNLPAFLFLGEAERYLNHVAYFIFAATILMAREASADWLVWSLIFYGALFWLIEVLVIQNLIKKSISEKNQEFKKVITFLMGIEKRQTVLLYPYGVGGGIFRVMIETPHRVIYPFCTTREFSQSFEANYSDGYPYVKLDQLDSLSDEFCVGCLVVYRKALLEKYGADWRPSDRWKKIDVGSELFDVYVNTKEVGNGFVSLTR